MLLIRFLGLIVPFFFPLKPGTILGKQIYNSNTMSDIILLVLLFASVGWIIAARIKLGGNWSESIEFKKDHQLITTGLYSVVRHPMYTGFFFLSLSTALIIGDVRALIVLSGVTAMLLGMNCCF
jgi:protein-S-isoprenylcysteine O-methyltransferase Ste14